MGFGVFIHRADSIYNDSPAERYQFPHNYLTRVQACVGDWIIYLEPSKVRETRGYFAVARVEKVIPDPTSKGMYLALIEPGSYLDFTTPVPFNGEYGVVETGVLNARGKNSGRAQAAVRQLTREDFNRIIEIGLADDMPVLPRIDLPQSNAPAFRENQSPFQLEVQRERFDSLVSRPIRDRVFRRRVVAAYDARCAITGLKLINGGGRAEVEAAHIRPVQHGGPDAVNNGLALSGTIHWMFDRGLICLKDDLEILISRQANDPESIRAMINKDCKARAPELSRERPHPAYLEWHREHCFKS